MGMFDSEIRELENGIANQRIMQREAQAWGDEASTRITTDRINTSLDQINELRDLDRDRAKG